MGGISLVFPLVTTEWFSSLYMYFAVIVLLSLPVHKGDLLIQVEPVIETVLKIGLYGNILDKVKIERDGR